MSDIALKDVIQRITGNEDRLTTSLEYYIGGEHYDSDDLEIHRRGFIKNEDLGFKFHFPFEPGDVLFMARNPHLRKAARVDFKGICSDASYILRTKDETRLRQDFIPLIMQSDDFWSFFTTNKTGSVNPLLNWSTLSQYVIKLPDVKVQKKYSEAVWSLQRLINVLREQIEELDLLVKSRFIEESSKWKSDYEYKPLSSYLELITYGFTNPMPDSEIGPWKITAKDIACGKIDYSTARRTSTEMYNSLTSKSKPHLNDVLLTKDGTLGRVAIVDRHEICVNQSVAVLRCNDKIESKFLAVLLQMPEYQRKMIADSSGGTIKHIYITKVDKMLVCVPDLYIQQEFITFIEQVDKSKFELEKHLEDTKRLQKALINQAFSPHSAHD